MRSRPINRRLRYPNGILLPAMAGPKPWSDKPLLDDPDRFQIAIMTDNTGGHRPGIWMKAVERLNLLRPTFVMSVGDLIEGYSSDPAELEAEWAEFLGFIDKLQMRFFFVAGNHDVSNPTAHELWRKKFGAEWYSFDYKGVHFMALSSEDTKDQIGPEQLAWIEKDLKEHADARWTMLFFHKPLWVMAERQLTAGNPDTTNWKKVEALLGDRPHTVFAGHVHHYVQYDRNGMKYYHLATTGGGSQLRGVPYGEFDHVAWLTMEQDGPTVVNLLLDGIVPADTITEAKIKRFRQFLAGTRLDVAPILVDDESGFSSGRIDLRLRNSFDAPVEVSAEIEGLPLRGLSVDPEPSQGLTLKAGPGETAELALDVRFTDKVAFQHFSQTVLKAKFRTVGDDAPLTAERMIAVVIDQKYALPPAAAEIAVDGNLQEWKELPLTTGDKPLRLGPGGQWQGADDAGLKFGTAFDDKFTYVFGEVTDDKLTEGDQLQLKLDARWIQDRKANGALKTGAYTLTLPPPTKLGAAQVSLEGTPKISKPAAVATARSSQGWTFEIALPDETFVKSQNDKWHSFQMTPILADVDDANEQPVEIIWRGTTEARTRNTNYGQFVRKRTDAEAATK
ncbi:MAG: metallophosphoesterase [Pirellulales bacterium]